MKGKLYILVIGLLAFYLIGQYSAWTVQRFDYVYNYMYEFTSPKLRTILAAGHDTLLADLSLIRGIQFYGRNYPLFDKHPVKYNQFKNLGEAVSATDPRYGGAYRFWGFAFTSAERGKVDSYKFLMHGAHLMSATSDLSNATRPAYAKVLPNMWQVAKDAGYVAVYELHAATPEWGCSAYKLAQLSPECPEFIPRLEYFACKAIEPDPLPHLNELVRDAMVTNNAAIKELNVEHIRRIVAEEHKTFWDFATATYLEIHGASPTRINDLKTVEILREATRRYREMSAQWFDDQQTRLFPNLMNPLTAVAQQPVVKEAVEPELPIDPYGGEYIILTIDGKPQLVASGVCLDERKDLLQNLAEELKGYKTTHGGSCPPDVPTLEKARELKVLMADAYGYPLLFDPLRCEFAFPTISEDSPPSLPSYGGEKPDEEGEESEGTEATADGSVSSATGSPVIAPTTGEIR